MNWLEIFSPEKFIEDMIELGQIEQDEIEREDPYGCMVTKLCHNACGWMYKEVRENYPHLLENLYLVTGSYKLGGIFGVLRVDHSWVEYRAENKNLILDLTFSQFRKTEDKLYISLRDDDFKEWASASFKDTLKVKELINSL